LVVVELIVDCVPDFIQMEHPLVLVAVVRTSKKSIQLADL